MNREETAQPGATARVLPRQGTGPGDTGEWGPEDVGAAVSPDGGGPCPPLRLLWTPTGRPRPKEAEPRGRPGRVRSRRPGGGSRLVSGRRKARWHLQSARGQLSTQRSIPIARASYAEVRVREARPGGTDLPSPGGPRGVRATETGSGRGRRAGGPGTERQARVLAGVGGVGPCECASSR